MVELNKVYCIDNLELLKQLPDNYIDLIYCDILYGTGRNFGDYQDLKPIRSEIERHYLPRLIEMRRVLKQNGTIYIHTGVNTSHWIRCLMDDVFGYNKFRNEIIWSYNSAPRKKSCFGNRHDVIFRYSVSDSFVFNPIREPYSLTAPRGYEKEKYYHSEGKVIGDVWNINILGQNDKTERTKYPTQKPKELISRFVLASTNENDIVADFYMGSGTSMVVAKELNRQFIGCDISQKAVDITNKRLKKVIRQ
jgi:DNA modification methylase